MGKKLFDRVKLGSIELKNRLIRSATWEALADANGHLPDTLYRTYEELAKGGIGAIITGFTSVADDDRCFGGMARLSNDGLIPEHQRLTEICHAESCPVIVQIALGEYGGGVEPDYMSADDIRQVISLFVNAAVRADKAGYDGVQIHAAHGFFLSRFISPASNHRKDEYGGSPERRGRILTEIIHGIREKAPRLHITMKINCSDFMHGGLMKFGIIGSSDMDQAGSFKAGLMASLMVRVTYNFIHTGRYNSKLMQKRYESQMADPDPYNRAFVAITGRDKYDMSFITKESIKNQIRSDLTTPLPIEIGNGETQIHVFYARKMGKKYLERYQKYFKSPVIHEQDMRHEELLGVYPMEWCALVKEICL